MKHKELFNESKDQFPNITPKDFDRAITELKSESRWMLD